MFVKNLYSIYFFNLNSNTLS